MQITGLCVCVCVCVRVREYQKGRQKVIHRLSKTLGTKVKLLDKRRTKTRRRVNGWQVGRVNKSKR